VEENSSASPSPSRWLIIVMAVVYNVVYISSAALSGHQAAPG